VSAKGEYPKEVGADLFGVVVEDRHPGADSGLDDHGWDAEPPVGHLAQAGAQAGHHRRHGDPGDRRLGVEPVEGEELGELQGQLVGGAPLDGRDPPVVREGRPAPGRPVTGAEEADDGLSVADVDGDEHVLYLATGSGPRERCGCRRSGPRTVPVALDR
jgi:hypothetical protein